MAYYQGVRFHYDCLDFKICNYTLMKTFKHFVGIDISKLTFDVSFDGESKQVQHVKFKNSPKGFTEFSGILAKSDFKESHTLICMENTGLYNLALCNYLLDAGFSVWVENPTQIKWSLGIQRGKNDKVDSSRILSYAKRNQDRYIPYRKNPLELRQLADLLALRRRLIDSAKSLKVPVGELLSAGMKEQANLIQQLSSEPINILKQQIKIVEDTIKKIIHEDAKLNEVFQYVISVKSIGFIAACKLILYTEAFTKFNSARKIASYCGIAPFEYSSGSSIKGKTRVHHMANKDLKTVLHMCALSSIANNEEMKIYYQRKVDEGKNKMLVLNAVRNKLLSRVFSCVKNKRMYIPYLAA